MCIITAYERIGYFKLCNYQRYSVPVSLSKQIKKGLKFKSVVVFYLCNSELQSIKWLIGKMKCSQWRIQDFPNGGALFCRKWGGAHPVFR